MTRPTVNELTRLAFVWAEQDRASLADCWPIGCAEHEKAATEAGWLREYRLKRWGKTVGDTLDNLPNKPLDHLLDPL